MIDSAFKKIFANKTEDMEIHFVYAGQLLYGDIWLGPIILEGIKKYKIRSVMQTVISMFRWYLITKEKMENYCLGKGYRKKSVNDDLESFFEDLQHGEESNANIITYFLPMLTTEELKLVDRKNSNFLKTFVSDNPDVNEAEMKLSESNSKFVLARSARKTEIIENLSA